MPTSISCTIQFKSQTSGETALAALQVVVFSPQEQKMRALISLLIFWAIAVICIMIPLGHFVLVPGFLIGGVIIASKRWKAVEEARDAAGSCPSCGNHICIQLDKNAELPRWHDCPECSDPLELQPASQESLPDQ